MHHPFCASIAHTRPPSGPPRRQRARVATWGLAAAWLLGGLAAPAHAASFDCRKASTWVEKAVCDDAELGALDEALANNYNGMLASNLGDGGRQHLRQEQRDWLKQRNACRSSDCLRQVYRERVDSVCDLPVVSGVHALCIDTEAVLAQPRVKRASASQGVQAMPENEISGAMCGLLNAQGLTLVSHRIHVNGQFIDLKLTSVTPHMLHWSGPNTEVRYTVRSGKLLQTPEGFRVGRGPMGQLQVTHMGKNFELPAREACFGSD